MAKDIGFEEVELEDLSEETEQEHAKGKEKLASETEGEKAEEISDNSKENTTKEGFWTRSWKKIKTGAKKSRKKLSKAFSKEPEDMSDDEFDEYLQDEEADGNEGYSSRYYALIEELKKMPSLMQLAKDSEPKDIAEAVGESEKAGKREETQVDEDKAGKEKTEAEKTKPEGKAKDEIETKSNDVAATKATEENESEPDKVGLNNNSEAEKINQNKKSADKIKQGEDTEVTAQDTATKEEPANKEPKTTIDTENKENKTETATQENKTLSEEPEQENKEPKKTDEVEKADAPEKSEQSEQSGKASPEEADKAKEESTIQKLIDMKDDGVKLGNDAVSIYKSSKRRKALEELEKKTDRNSAKGRQLAYMKEQAKKESVSGGFSMARNIVDTANKAIGKFGSEKLSGIAEKVSKFVNMALEFGQNLAVKKFEKQSVKNGLKGLLGGSEVYTKLKDKYKLNGGTMRRAIRVAANRSSVQELVDADKDKLSEEYAHNVESKDESTASYMGLAGGRSADAARSSMGRSVADTKEKKEEQEGK